MTWEDEHNMTWEEVCEELGWPVTLTWPLEDSRQLLTETVEALTDNGKKHMRRQDASLIRKQFEQFG